MTGLRHDLRQAWRALLKSPGFTVAATLTLALGVGLNSAVFSVVNGVLFKPLPVAAPGELVNVYSEMPVGIFTHGPMAYPDYLDVRDQVRGLSQVVAHSYTRLVWSVEGENELIQGEAVSGNYFATLGLTPAAGRFFTPEDDRPGSAQPVAVLAYAAWQRRFGGDPGVIGSTLRLNGQPATVVAVAPAGFAGLTRGLAPEIWVPIHLTRSLNAPANINLGDEDSTLHRLDDRGRLWLWVTARRGAGVSLQQVQGELAALSHRLRVDYPQSNEERSLLALPATSVRLLPGVDTVLHVASLVVMAIVGLVLLIASANIANMLLARAVGRRREIATRLSLGASRGALVRQLLVESLLLSLLGGGAGLGLSFTGVGLLRSVGPGTSLPIALDVSPDFRVLLFALAASTLTAALFGLAPAFEALRTDIAMTLHDTSRGTSEPSSRGALRRGLVVAEVALSLLLLICSGLFLRSMMNAQRIDPGIDPDGVVVASLAPDLQGYSREAIEDLYRRLLEELRALPGVRSVSAASLLPLTFDLHVETVAPEGGDAATPDGWFTVDAATVAPGYFETVGIPLVRGRHFSEQETAGSVPVVVVNQTLAERLWPGEDAIGKRLRSDSGEANYLEVIGIARNGKYRTLGEAPRPYFWRPFAQAYQPGRTLLVAFASDEQAAPAAVRQTIESVDAELAVRELVSMGEAMSLSLLLPRFGAGLFGLFGLLGMLLAAIGMYGVIAYSASRRTREMGIRMALGAGRLDVLRLMLREGLRLTAIGVAVGLLAAVAATRTFRAVLYGIGATDFVTFAAVSLFLALVALVATYVPAQRAARMDPLQALHYE